MGIGEAMLELNPDSTRQAEEYLFSGFEVVKKLHPENSVEYCLALAQVGRFYLKNGEATKGVRYLVNAYTKLVKIEGDSAVRPAAISEFLTEQTDNNIISKIQ